MTIMLRSLLSLLVLVIVAAAAQQQQECEIGEDGTCIDNDGCVDTNVKCDQWMSTGMYVRSAKWQ